MEKSPFVIGVAGGSGSGKSSFLRHLITGSLEKKSVTLSLDHYYKDLSHLSPTERKEVNFDHPDALELPLLCKHLKTLIQGKPIQRPSYDFITHTRPKTFTEVRPQAIIFLDGIFSLFDKNILDLIDLKIYIDLADDLRFIRRLVRDQDKRGRDIDSTISQYLASVRPMHFKYILPTRDKADHIISWEVHNAAAVANIRKIIFEKLGQDQQ